MKKLLQKGLFLSIFFLPTIAMADTGDGENTILSVILMALAGVIVTILGWVGRLVGKFVSKKIEGIENDALQTAAYVAVRFVEDAYKKTEGKAKFEKAYESIAKKFPGIEKEDIEAAIRAMFVNFKAEMPKNE